MISYQVYKLLHLLGVLMLFLSIGGLILHAISGGSRDYSWRKLVMITHGIGILLALVGGFGLLARLDIIWPWPGWVMTKVAIWVILAAFPALIARNPLWATGFWWTTLVLGGLAAYLAGSKPF
jgi:hypothetical protein